MVNNRRNRRNVRNNDNAQQQQQQLQQQQREQRYQQRQQQQQIVQSPVVQMDLPGANGNLITPQRPADLLQMVNNPLQNADLNNQPPVQPQQNIRMAQPPPIVRPQVDQLLRISPAYSHQTPQPNLQQSPLHPLYGPQMIHQPPVHVQPQASCLIQPQPNAPQPVIVYAAPTIPSLNSFDGSTDIYDFFDKFDSMAIASDWSRDRQAKLIQAYLIGEAKVLFQTLHEDDRHDINRIKQILKIEYGKNKDYYWQAFQERKPKLNEKPKSYAYSLQSLLDKAMPEMSHVCKEQILKNKFIGILPKSIQQFIKFNGEKPWYELIKSVESVIESFGINEIQVDPMDFEINRTVLRPSYNQNGYSNGNGHSGSNGYVNSYGSSNGYGNSYSTNNRYGNGYNDTNGYNNNQDSNIAYDNNGCNGYNGNYSGFSNHNANNYPNNSYKLDHSVNNGDFIASIRQQEGNRNNSSNLSHDGKPVGYGHRDNRFNNYRNNAENNGNYRRNTNQPPDLDSRRIFRCFHCNYVGHVKKYCPFLQEDDDKIINYRSGMNTNPYSEPYKRESIHKVPVPVPIVNHQVEKRDGVNNKPIEMSSAKTNTIRISSNSHDLLRYKMSLKFNNDEIELNALLDTGSTHSFININVLPYNIRSEIKNFMQNPSNKANENGIKIRQIKVQTVSSEVMSICSEMVLNFSIGCWKGMHEFIITDAVQNEEVLLGIDFIKNHKISIIGQDQIEVTMGEENVDLTCRVKERVVLPPYSERVLNMKFDKSIKINRVMLFESYDHSTQGVVFAKGIVNELDECKVVALNYQNKPVTFLEGQKVGLLTSCELMDEEPCQIDSKVNFNNLIEDTSDLMSTIQIGDKLKEEEKAKIKLLLSNYNRLFSRSSTDVGQTSAIRHKIDVGMHKPIKSAPYRVPHVLRGEIEKHVNKMLEANIIEYSDGPWSSPVILVKKKNGEYRFCIDFRRLNDVTVKDAYPIPRAEDTFDALSGAKYFSIIDLASGFWQIKVNPEDRDKTAFCVSNGLFQFRVMPYGLTNAPATFQRLMDLVLRGLSWKQCIVYLDDVIVFSSTFEDHLERLNNVFQKFIEFNLKLQPSKCKFGYDRVNYLGHEISNNGIQPTNENIQAILAVQPPNSKTLMRRFLGMISYYRKFIPSLSRIASPLYRLTMKKSSYNWTDECQKSFDLLKQKLVQPPILQYPNYELPFLMKCDASFETLGAVLSQLHNGDDLPIAYASRMLNQCEQKYTVTEKELLAITWSVKYFKHYLYNRQVTVQTDHKPIADLKNLKEPDGRIGRLYLKLQHLNIKIEYLPGRLNKGADALSRLIINSISISSCDWATEQSKDPALNKLIMLIANNQSVHDDEQLGAYVGLRNSLFIDSSRVLRLKVDNETPHFNGDGLIVMPSHLTLSVLQYYHSEPVSGHLGINKTLKRVKSLFFWLNMNKTIVDFVRTCDTCQKHKHTNYTPKAPLKPIVSTQPWQLINIDVTGPMTTTKSGNRYIIVCIDHFSKYVEAIATSSYTAEITAKFILNRIVYRYGTPTNILTDQGTNFESSLIKSLCTSLKINKLRSTAYHPSTNGLVERVNRTIKQMLSCYVNYEHTDWDKYLNQLIYAYNTSVQQTNGISPYEIIFGRKPVMLEVVSNDLDTPTTYVEKLKVNLSYIYQLVREYSAIRRGKQVLEHDRFCFDDIEYDVGDLVLLKNYRTNIGKTRKFEPKYIGPYEIIETIGDVNYKVKNSNDLSEIVTHYNRMRPYVSSGIEATNFNEGVVEETIVMDPSQTYVTRFGRSSRQPIRFS